MSQTHLVLSAPLINNCYCEGGVGPCGGFMWPQDMTVKEPPVALLFSHSNVIGPKPLKGKRISCY